MDKLGSLIIHLSHHDIHVNNESFALLLRVLENNERMLFLQAEELKEKEKENHKLVNDLEEKQTKCSKLVTTFCSSYWHSPCACNLPYKVLINYLNCTLAQNVTDDRELILLIPEAMLHL